MEIMNGNMNTVIKEGNTVRKLRTQYSETINAFLLHLKHHGFSCAMEYIKHDLDYDYYSFIEGNLLDLDLIRNIEEHQQLLMKISELLHKYHDIAAKFDWSNYNFYLKYTGTLPIDTVCHNDFAPYNLIADHLEIKGIIDFDTIAPAPRIWDIAYATYRFIGLGTETPEYFRSVFEKDEIVIKKLLLEYFCKLNKVDKTLCINVLIDRLKSLLSLFDQEIGNNNVSFIKMKQEGHYDFYLEEIDYIRRVYLQI